tara:strand:- start:7211 stop:8281 length:1071 start_codon:yes stop_codon:yes gene_type:complete
MKKKSLSVKKTIPKNFNFKKILRDEKISKIFRSFSENFTDLNIKKRMAIAVSGGPDSMALCFLVNCYKFTKNNNIQPKFYLVDHGLREGSSSEAKLVRQHLYQKKINLKIIKWKGKKPKSNIQSLARKKRYEILFTECKRLNIQKVVTAHHQDDVYETFFSRLLRGSGTEGLTSFKDVEKKFIFKGCPITVSRPLLDLNKQDLIYISKKVFDFFIDDPSNEIEIFQRVRLRKLITGLKNQGLDFKKLNLTLNNLASSNKAINEIVKRNISQNITYHKSKYLIGPNFFLLPDEVIFRSMSVLFKKINKKEFPPRGKKMIRLINELKNKDDFKATLGGTIVEKIENSVIVSKEKTKKR